MKQIILLFIITFCLSITIAQTVFKTPSGAKYHLGNCRMVKNVSEEITLEQAKKLGLEPCKICHPTSYGSTIDGNQQPQGITKTVQCKGITKSGTRCKHMTSIGNGYCFQHQP